MSGFLADGNSERGGYWPWSTATQPPLPPCLPDGSAWPRISIVTPSFEQGEFIEETILSVLRQGYPNVEHLVVDGGSTDTTGVVLDRYRSRLTWVVSERDRGQSHAINKGMARATGDILTWLNSDDLLAPGALHAVALAFHMSKADLVAGVVELRSGCRLVGRHLTSCGNGPLPLEDLLDLENCWNAGQFFYQPEVMFTRRIWEQAGAHVSEDWHYSMDYELWLRFAAAKARLHIIGAPVAWFRLHKEQKTADRAFLKELPLVRDGFLKDRGGVAPPARSKGHRHELRVALVNDVGYAFDAGIGHRRIARALHTAGHDVFAFSLAEVAQPRLPPEELQKLLLRRLRAVRPDLVIFGNLHGAHVDVEVLEAVASQMPVACVLHDLWLLTGYCAYPGPCRDYIGRIDEALGSDGVEGGAVPPRAGIRFGMEHQVFRPQDALACRRDLGVPEEAFVVMTSASDLGDPRKGLPILRDALARLDAPDLLLIAPGGSDNAEPPPIPGMRRFGYLDDPAALARLYAAADLFIGPSVDESLGMVFIEAAASGTPSLGFAVGGVPEAIADGVSGWVLPEVSVELLAKAIGRLHRDRDLCKRTGQLAALWARSQFTEEAAAHSITRALFDTGLAESLGLKRKLGLREPKDPPRGVECLSRGLRIGDLLEKPRMLRFVAHRALVRLWRRLPLGPRMRLRSALERRMGRRIPPPD